MPDLSGISSFASDRPRVLHVLGGLDPGGVETWLLELVRHAGGSGWAFDFCLLGSENGAYTDELERRGSRIWRCPVRRPELFTQRLYRLLRRTRYDIVHSHVHYFSGWVLRVARAAGVPVRLAHSHNSHDGGSRNGFRLVYRSWMKSLLRRSMSRGLACSATAAEALFGKDHKKNPRVRPAPYGIDLEKFRRLLPDRIQLRNEFGIPAGVPVVGHVGRLEPQKNQDFLLEVAAATATVMPQARFVIVGEGRLRERLEAKADQLGLLPRIRFAGERGDISELMVGLFDAFLLPSLHEGLPLVALEAQAAGLPLLMSNHITEEAVVLPRISHHYSLKAGPLHWAVGLRRMLESKRLSPSEACRRLAEKGFGIGTSLENLTANYDELVRTLCSSDPEHSLRAEAVSTKS